MTDLTNHLRAETYKKKHYFEVQKSSYVKSMSKTLKSLSVKVKLGLLSSQFDAMVNDP
jgi:hypothetical protein